MVALHTALAGGGGLRSLSLWEPPLFTAGPSTAFVLDEYRGRLAAGDLDGANLLLMEKVARVPQPLLAQLAGAGAGGDPDEVRRSTAGWLHDLEALAADNGDIERWSGVELPVLLMQGAQTWEPMPTTMDALARQLPHVQRVQYADQMHFAPSVAPDLVAATVQTFLRSVPQADRCTHTARGGLGVWSGELPDGEYGRVQ
jgi:pimeloyl-ACP methyl ester carboxylesterase